MRELNLLQSAPKVVRDISARLVNKDENRRMALQFGHEYFDGTREQGYGGYSYDGRWIAVAERLVELYNLKPGDRVLDVGCAKGFLVKDLRAVQPGLDVYGLDVSGYALEQCEPEAEPFIFRGSCDRLPFADNSFELVLAINTVHNLEEAGCRDALREMVRVSNRDAFVQVDAYRNEDEREIFETWMLTAQTYLTPDGWHRLFEDVGYDMDYYWTVLLPDGNVL